MEKRNNGHSSSSNKNSKSASANSYGGGFKRRANFDIAVVDYKDSKALQKFVSERGRIIPSRVTGVPSKKQREIALAIKRARFLALMPYKAV